MIGSAFAEKLFEGPRIVLAQILAALADPIAMDFVIDGPGRPPVDGFPVNCHTDTIGANPAR